MLVITCFAVLSRHWSANLLFFFLFHLNLMMKQILSYEVLISTPTLYVLIRIIHNFHF